MSAPNTELRSRVLAHRTTGIGASEISRTLAREGIVASKARVHQILKEYGAAGLPTAGLEARAIRMRELGLDRDQIAFIEGLKTASLKDRGVKNPDREIAQKAERELLKRLHEGGLTIKALAEALGTDGGNRRFKWLRSVVKS